MAYWLAPVEKKWNLVTVKHPPQNKMVRVQVSDENGCFAVTAPSADEPENFPRRGDGFSFPIRAGNDLHDAAGVRRRESGLEFGKQFPRDPRRSSDTMAAGPDRLIPGFLQPAEDRVLAETRASPAVRQPFRFHMALGRLANALSNLAVSL